MGASIDIILYEMESFLEEQKEIIEKIQVIKTLQEEAKKSHIKKYYDRELKGLMEDLYNSNRDMIDLYNELQK